MAKEQEQFWPN